VRSFINKGQGNEPDKTSANPGDKAKPETRKISKNVGEYVDYEELKGNDK
jgi:hypothetical protein